MRNFLCSLLIAFPFLLNISPSQNKDFTQFIAPQIVQAFMERTVSLGDGDFIEITHVSLKIVSKTQTGYILRAVTEADEYYTDGFIIDYRYSLFTEYIIEAHREKGQFVYHLISQKNIDKKVYGTEV